MRNEILTGLMAASIVGFSGCSSLPGNERQQGTAIGGATGAAVGAAVAKENRVLGAIIGGAVGAADGRSCCECGAMEAAASWW